MEVIILKAFFNNIDTLTIHQNELGPIIFSAGTLASLEY